MERAVPERALHLPLVYDVPCACIKHERAVAAVNVLMLGDAVSSQLIVEFTLAGAAPRFILRHVLLRFPRSESIVKGRLMTTRLRRFAAVVLVAAVAQWLLPVLFGRFTKGHRAICWSPIRRINSARRWVCLPCG